MSKFKGKFEQLTETTIVRYQNGGLITGDLVKVLPSALKHPKLKDLGEHVKGVIKSLIDSTLNLRVCAVKSIHPSSSSLSDGIGGGGTSAPTDFWVDVAIERAPGSFSDPMTLPIEVLELIPNDGNLAPIPDELRRKDKVNIKPKDTEYTTHQNPKTNTTLDYVKGSAKQPVLKDSVERKTDDDLLEEAYGKVFNAPKSKVFTVCVANAFADNVEYFLANENMNHIKTVNGHKTSFDVVFSESKEVLTAKLKKGVMGDNTFITVMDSDQQIDENS